MWKIYRNTVALAATLIGLSVPDFALAQNVYNLNQNQTGLNLPGVNLPQGSDEVRAADGTTCRSAVSGNGAYVDIGIIGNQATAQFEESATAYGRLVIPLGVPKGRIDCRRLYDLEIDRLKAEIQLLKAGAGSLQQASNDEYKTGWTNGKK